MDKRSPNGIESNGDKNKSPKIQENLVEVAVPIAGMDSLTYTLPPFLQGQVSLGMRLIVPYMKKYKTGVVVDFPASSDLAKIREVIDIADSLPPLPEYMLNLCRWIADYYCCPLGEVMAAAHPAGMLAESEKMVRLTEEKKDSPMLLEGYSADISAIMEMLRQKKQISVDKLRKAVDVPGLMNILNQMVKRELLEIYDGLPTAKLKPRWEIVLCVNDELTEDYLETWLRNHERKSPKKALLVRYLQNSPPATRKTLMQEIGVSSSTIKALVDKGILKEKRREIIRASADTLPEDYIIVHTEAQKTAISAVKIAFDKGEFAPFLLFGVTGSGKTEVYLEAISHCLKSGRTALVLVPEIALTPQIASRFRKRFGGQVVIMHSRISSGERFDSWRRLASGKARVVIGARSALFAPLVNPGLIVVDEEHEPSFKQFNRPHYNARDCAVYLAKALKIPIVLGSATPSIETYENARGGKYRLLELPQRVASGKFSTFHLVDLTAKGALIPNTSISPLLMDKIEDRLTHGDKVIILQNRRGFSTFLKCRFCGKVDECPNCSVTLTYHATNRRMRCHLCGFQKRAPAICGECGGSELLYCGAGTQRVEDDIYRLFPDARIVRMDLDTTSGIDSHFKILEAFARGDYDILLGTQMVAKGLDFSDVTLVGIISADTELLRPDFRAEERTFRLLTQAAGRSGRHRPGEVVVQTYNPEHKVFNLVKYNDYLGFFEKTVRDRRGLRYPPFGRLIAMRIWGAEESKVAQAAVSLAQIIPRTYIKILGPSPALPMKVKRKYHYRILIKAGNLPQKRLNEIKDSLKNAREETLNKYRADKIAVEIDVDPLEVH